MGIVAETFWRQPGTIRSTHPGASFAAWGPLAERICKPQPLSPPHGIESPVGEVYKPGGQVLLLGVEHSENTTLHLAESLLPVPYSVSHPCVVQGPDGHFQAQIAETDHCCMGFRRLDAWLGQRGLQREGLVGYGPAKLVDAQALVAVALERLQADPFVFLCPKESECSECLRAWQSVS